MEFKKREEDFKKYLLFAIVVGSIFLSFKIIQPYIIILISAFILAYLIRPIYLRLNGKLRKSFSAIICVVILLFVFLLPVAVIVGGVTNQAYNLVNVSDLPIIFEKIASWSIFERFNIDILSFIDGGVLLIISLLSSAISYIPMLLISLIVLLLGVYYILISWEELSNNLKNYLPFKDKKGVAKDIDDATRGIVHGSFFIAIIEFLVSSVGFYLSGVNLYLLLPLLIFFFAFIPAIGPTIVWVPLVVYYLFVGNWSAMTGVLITGVVLSIGIDTILRVKILGKNFKVNPFIMLIGILGGVSLFGIFGFLIGPIVLIYTLRILEDLVSK